MNIERCPTAVWFKKRENLAIVTQVTPVQVWDWIPESRGQRVWFIWIVSWIAGAFLPGSIPGGFPGQHTLGSVGAAQPRRMTHLHDLRLRLLVQQESERIAESQPDELDLSVVQARTLCWLALLTEAHEEQACDAERRGDVEQAMGWFADAMRLRDVIQVVTSIEIPLAAHSDDGGLDDPLDDPKDWGDSLAV